MRVQRCEADGPSCSGDIDSRAPSPDRLVDGRGRTGTGPGEYAVGNRLTTADLWLAPQRMMLGGLMAWAGRTELLDGYDALIAYEHVARRDALEAFDSHRVRRNFITHKNKSPPPASLPACALFPENAVQPLVVNPVTEASLLRRLAPDQA